MQKKDLPKKTFCNFALSWSTINAKLHQMQIMIFSKFNSFEGPSFIQANECTLSRKEGQIVNNIQKMSLHLLPTLLQQLSIEMKSIIFRFQHDSWLFVGTRELRLEFLVQ